MFNQDIWQLIASGLHTAYMTLLTGKTNRDQRKLLLAEGAFFGAWQLQCTETLQFVPDRRAMETIVGWIQNVDRTPVLVYQIPFVQNIVVASGGITTDPAPEGYQVYLYSWNFVEFTEVGPLSEHATPPTGFYVLALKSNGGALGLPSPFIEVTANTFGKG